MPILGELSSISARANPEVASPSIIAIHRTPALGVTMRWVVREKLVRIEN
jgi:hypothetical protein